MSLIIRPGYRDRDGLDFARLILMSAPAFLPAVFGKGVLDLMQALFRTSSNLFSHEETLFAETDGMTAGMLLGCGSAEHGMLELATGLNLLSALGWRMPRLLPRLLRAAKVVGHVPDGSYYVSNLAVYPQFRGLGAGSGLLRFAEERAGREGNESILLDVETNNVSAIRLYEGHGYRRLSEPRELRLAAGLVFEFSRMGRSLRHN